MMRLQVAGVDGSSWDLTDPRSAVFIEADTIEGLVGTFSDNLQAFPTAPGGVVDLRDRVVEPLAGSFTVVVKDPQAWARFRAGWSTCSDSTMVLTIGGVVFSVRARLSTALPFPAVRPAVGTRLVVSVVSYDGVWLTAHSQVGPGGIMVVNAGDVPVWPVLSWLGAGGVVTLPSGAQFSLPTVSSRYSLSMDRREAGLVRDEAGLVDRDLSRQVMVLGEGVPVGESRTWMLPAGVVLSWKLGHLDPWSGGV